MWILFLAFWIELFRHTLDVDSFPLNNGVNYFIFWSFKTSNVSGGTFSYFKYKIMKTPIETQTKGLDPSSEE